MSQAFLKTIECEDMTLEEVFEELDVYPVTTEALQADQTNEDMVDNAKLQASIQAVLTYLQVNPDAKVYQVVGNDDNWQYVDLDTGLEVAAYNYFA